MLVNLYDARVAVSVGDEDVTREVPRHVRGPVEGAPSRRRWRRARGRGHCGLHRFVATAQHHHYTTGRVELDDHVRAFVGRPDVVVRVDPHRVGERKAVQVLADLAKERALGTELEELRGARAVHRGAFATPHVDENVAPGVHRHPRDFAEVHPGWKLEQVSVGVEADFRNGLLRGAEVRCKTEERGEGEAFHRGPCGRGRVHCTTGSRVPPHQKGRRAVDPASAAHGIAQ